MLYKKRLNNCKAYIYHDHKNIGDSSYIALVSYSTLVLVWQANGRILYVGRNFNCSATTRQHVGKFLAQMGFGVSYLRIKNWFEKGFNPYTGKVINESYYRDNYGYDMLIYPSFYNDLYNRGCFSVYDLENAIEHRKLG